MGSTRRRVTTDEELTEFLTALSSGGPYWRGRATDLVRSIMEDPNVYAVPQSRITFLQGLARYENRLDKAYSLQDCISMNTMAAMGIREILTSDHHFEQEGFIILMKA